MHHQRLHPITPEPLERIRFLKCLTQAGLPIKNFVKIVQGIRPCGAFIPKFNKLYSLRSLRPNSALMGWNLALRVSRGGFFNDKFHTYQCKLTSRPLARQKSPQNPSWVINAGLMRCAYLAGNNNKGKGKGLPYSIPSVGPGADPGLQAVSLQVTV